MSPLVIVVGLIAAQRLAELSYARRNTRALVARGAVELGQGHYPVFVLLHAAWLASLLAFVPLDAPVSWSWLALLVVLQALRLWVIVSLGPYWTTRVIVL